MFEAKLALSDAGVQVFVEQDQGRNNKRCSGGSITVCCEAPGIRGKEESHVQFNRWLARRYRDAWPGGESGDPRLRVVGE